MPLQLCSGVTEMLRHMPRHKLLRSARSYRLLLLASLVLLAFSTRFLPVSVSQFPFNNDSLTECSMAEDVIRTEHLEFSEDGWYFDTHSVATPAYTVLLAFASSIIGTSPFDIAQLVTAAIAILAVVGGYALALRISGSANGAYLTGLSLALLGTLVFLTGSAWRGSLGFSALVFLFYAYANRNVRGMIVVECATLAVLLLIHHLVMVLSCLSIAYLTLAHFAVSSGTPQFSRRRFLVDVAEVGAFSVIGYVYYSAVSLDRLRDFLTGDKAALMVLSLSLLSVLVFLYLRMPRSLKRTFAPIPGLVLFAFFMLNYETPIFGYSSGGPDYVVVLAAALSIIVSVAWYGLEKAISSRSFSGAIPVCQLLPVATVILFALLTGFTIHTHNTIYRSFDYADFGIALGVGFSYVGLRHRPRLRRATVFAVVAVLIITFPFGYLSGQLIGVRHDTQQYEVDAIEWVSLYGGDDAKLQTDERLGYIGMALYGFEKNPYLPDRLDGENPLPWGWFYAYEEEWAVVGVNDYPRGYPVLDTSRVESVLLDSNIFYAGGPEHNSIIIFMVSEIDT